MKNVRITVLKCLYLEDLAEKYLADGNPAPCPLQKEGDVFLYTGGAEKPEGLCPWAWIDLYRGISAISAGGTWTPWTRYENQQVLCCSDGVRPVVYLLEAVEGTECT